MGEEIILPPGYEPSENEEYMNPFQLEYFRQLLIRRREEINAESRGTLKHLQEEDWHEPDLNDRAARQTEATTELKASNRSRKLLGKIDEALQRINSKEYGYCEETGEPIGLKRLKARPVANLSIERQEEHERYERSHLNHEREDEDVTPR